MKRIVSIAIIVIMSVVLFTVPVYADEIDLTVLDNGNLISLYEKIKDEMANRGLLVEKMTLREGKFIVGVDIVPGNYKITCIETDGDTYGDLYSSLGSMYSSLGDDDGIGSLMGSLGGVMGKVITTEVEIIGDYGTVLKSFSLKSGDSVSIKLEDKTAIKISSGSCELEMN